MNTILYAIGIFGLILILLSFILIGMTILSDILEILNDLTEEPNARTLRKIFKNKKKGGEDNE